MSIKIKHMRIYEVFKTGWCIQLQTTECFLNHLEKKRGDFTVKIALINENSEYRVKPIRLKKKELLLCLLTTFILFCLLISPVAAAVTELKISPLKPAVGDIIKVTGKASPNESIKAQVTLNQRVRVSGGGYQLFVDDINVPADTNTRFTVTAYGVKNLHVQVKKFGFIISNSTAQGRGGIAIITKGPVLPTTYDVLIDGDALAHSGAVYLMITASQILHADSNGYFESNIDTSSMPAGKYTVRVGNMLRTIQLRPAGHGDGHKNLIADFSAYPSYGKPPLKVQFTDKSKGSPTSWYWSFGDGTYSTVKNPEHTYNVVGKYTVTLTVNNEEGSDTVTKSEYIKVSKNTWSQFDSVTVSLPSWLK
jgi:PKD repeat protein